jgi:hypothetical protein
MIIYTNLIIHTFYDYLHSFIIAFDLLVFTVIIVCIVDYEFYILRTHSFYDYLHSFIITFVLVVFTVIIVCIVDYEFYILRTHTFYDYLHSFIITFVLLVFTVIYSLYCRLWVLYFKNPYVLWLFALIYNYVRFIGFYGHL